jgi:hypothetical protein
LTLHVTEVFEVPVTFAVNCCVPKFATLAEFGVTVTETGEAAVMVTVALPFIELFACDVAVIGTCGALGIAAGAVYSPACVMLPLDAPPLTAQVTFVFVVPDTMALNCCVLFTATLAVAGAIVTEIDDDGLLVAAQPAMTVITHVRAQTVSARRIISCPEGWVPLAKRRLAS